MGGKAIEGGRAQKQKGVLERSSECSKEEVIIWAADGARKTATEN